jgi:hypothetical protein
MAPLLRGKIFQARVYHNGMPPKLYYGFEQLDQNPTRPSFKEDSFERFVETLAAYSTDINTLESWGDPTIGNIAVLGRSAVELRFSIGAQVPEELEDLAIMYSKQLHIIGAKQAR